MSLHAESGSLEQSTELTVTLNCVPNQKQLERGMELEIKGYGNWKFDN